MNKFFILIFVFFILKDGYGQAEKRFNNSFVYEGCGCGGVINLRIHNGLYDPYGGQPVSDEEEVTKGAITVANLNDTDGDGIIDNIDNNVTSSSLGRNEVDLMKITISKEGEFPSSCETLELFTTGEIELWQNSTKGTIANRTIEIDDLPIDLWIEATAVSNSLRDISIKAVMDGDVKDEVKATAIWVDKENVYNTRTSTPAPSSLGIDKQSLLDFLATYTQSVDGTLYGFGYYRPIPEEYVSPVQDGFFGGRSLFEFKIKPNEIENELSSLGIRYDVGRRLKSTRSYLIYQNSSSSIDLKEFPSANEESNDDGECYCPQGPSDMIDEDETPTSDKIFSYDAPSEIAIGSAVAFSNRKMTFKEYARVSFGEDIAGNIQEGSKCSEDYNWELEYVLASTDTYKAVDPYNANFQKLELVMSSGVMTSLPRLITGMGNGPITIAPINITTELTYYIQMSANADSWNLFEKTPTGANLLATSNSNINGPWYITSSNANVTIANGSVPFSSNCILFFNIWNQSNVNNHFTAN